jgi:thioredoxin reductase
MKRSHLLLAVAALVSVIVCHLFAVALSSQPTLYGGLPWYGWTALICLIAFASTLWMWSDTWRERRMIEQPAAAPDTSTQIAPPRITEQDRARLDPSGADYPYPVIFPERCIGCYACVEACPHGVLAIVNGISATVARDQCMEDTACEVECPVNPKACIVINTTKRIPKRKVPQRNEAFMTDVPNCYIIGDVSGTPLIKNAANEGAGVVGHIKEEIGKANGNHSGSGNYDVAIIGAGPAGLSAAIAARREGLRYVAIEQDRVLATIEAYPANKYVFFKPDSMKSVSPLDVSGDGKQREAILEEWKGALAENQVTINEEESCRAITPAGEDGYFVVRTTRRLTGTEGEYRARHIILAIGNRGTPMKLGVSGEDLQIKRGDKIEDKVQYKLTNPADYKRRRIIVVGAGNSAIEAAVDLVSWREGDRIKFRSDEETNEVTLVIRSDIKNDVKFGNKRQLYECIDEGKIKIFFGTAIKEIKDEEVVLMSARTKEERARIPNDNIFALIGGDRPTKFLESIGIKIG